MVLHAFSQHPRDVQIDLWVWNQSDLHNCEYLSKKNLNKNTETQLQQIHFIVYIPRISTKLKKKYLWWLTYKYALPLPGEVTFYFHTSCSPSDSACAFIFLFLNQQLCPVGILSCFHLSNHFVIVALLLTSCHQSWFASVPKSQHLQPKCDSFIVFAACLMW